LDRKERFETGRNVIRLIKSLTYFNYPKRFSFGRPGEPPENKTGKCFSKIKENAVIVTATKD